ncbi:MAG: hypothetical protein HY711_02840 [Candidatus Melainabacteria bacterium]|nr:hypothetical protein [Candidatus Melainabacteria bacterium]
MKIKINRLVKEVTVMGTASCPMCDLLGEDGDFCRANRLEDGDIFHSTCGQIYPAWLVNNRDLLMDVRATLLTIVKAIVEVDKESWLTIDELTSEREGELTLRLSEDLPKWVKDPQALAITISLGGDSATTPANETLRPMSHKHQKICHHLVAEQFKLESITCSILARDGLTVRMEKQVA